MDGVPYAEIDPLDGAFFLALESVTASVSDIESKRWAIMLGNDSNYPILTH